MSIALRIALAILTLIFVVNVFLQVKKGKLLLKYSLLWLFLSLLLLLCLLFPNLIYRLSTLIGFGVPSNFLFFCTVIVLFAIVLSLSIAISRLLLSVKNLTQRLAILEHDCAEYLKRNPRNDDGEK